MDNLYLRMADLYKKNGFVASVTEINPDCGRKYIVENIEELSLCETDTVPFLQKRDGKTLFFEIFYGPPTMVIVGGGHISRSLSQIGKLLDFQVVIIDDREEFCNEKRFPEADSLYCMDIEKALEHPFGNNTYYVILSRGHKDDKRALEFVLRYKKYRYVGMIGSRKKVSVTLQALKQGGCEENQLKGVHAPIGLPIGAITPAEIAVSIMAEIVQEMNHTLKDKNQIDVLEEILKLDGAFVLTTIIEKNGSSPRGIGSKMIVVENGTVLGSIGGGAIEYAVIQHAKNMLKSGRAEVQHYDLSSKNASDLGMICGGAVGVLFESVI